LLLCAVAAQVAPALAATPVAQKDAAAVLSRLAADKHDAREFAKAADLFHEAYQLDRDFPAYLYSAARCEDKAGMNAEAERDYQRFIDAAPRGHEKLGDAAKNLSDIRAKVAAEREAAAARAKGPPDKAAARLAAEKARAEQTERDRLAAEKKAADQKAAQEKIWAEQKAREQKAAERNAAEQKAARDKALADQQAREQKAAEQKVLRDKALAELHARERAATELRASDRVTEQKAAAERAARTRKAPESPAAVAAPVVRTPGHSAGSNGSGAVPWLIGGGALGAVAIGLAGWAAADASSLEKDLNKADAGHRITGVGYDDAIARASSIDTRAWIAGGCGVAGAALLVYGGVRLVKASNISVAPRPDGRGFLIAGRF